MSMTSANKKFVFSDIGHCLVFGFGAGLSPRMPGTVGTLLAFPLYWGSFFLAEWGRWTLFLILFGSGIYLCGRAGRALNKHDDGGIVLDEIAAFYAVLLCMPEDYRWHIAAFLLFRFFDALKPPPIGWLDKNVRGGFGVMIDDLAAAMTTAAILLVAKEFVA